MCKWISVEEKMPELKENILFLVGDIIFLGWLAEFLHGLGFMSDDNNSDKVTSFLVENVTHWMPIPELPKEEEE